MKISLIQPSRDNLKYLQWSYDSIRKNQGKHTVEICVADDFSSDGLADWCKSTAKKDKHFKWIQNKGPKRLGHTILYDKLINEVASHDICMIFHADMYLAPKALDFVEKYIEEKTIVTLTRIEPPWWPHSLEKFILEFGTEPEEFKEKEFLSWLKDTHLKKAKGITTYGAFAPWAFYKKDFQEIGGHDPMYAPQSKEDSDIFNRFKLNGVKFIQTWEGCVYHLCCRGSRFNPNLTKPGQDSDEWTNQNRKSERNFIRKWGSNVKHGEKLEPVIIPKFATEFRITNCTQEALDELEPYCQYMYVDCGFKRYLKGEQKLTTINLSDKIQSLSSFDLENPKGNLVVEFDYSKLTNEEKVILKNINEITISNVIAGKATAGSLSIDCRSHCTYERKLIKV